MYLSEVHTCTSTADDGVGVLLIVTSFLHLTHPLPVTFDFVILCHCDVVRDPAETFILEMLSEKGQPEVVVEEQDFFQPSHM